MTKQNLPSRFSWPDGFPDVVAHCEEVERDSHPAYLPGKSGDKAAAVQLAQDLVSKAALETLRHIMQNRKAIIVPVTAIEGRGFNAIPDALAQEIASKLGLEKSSGEIVQSNTVHHTRAKGYQRLVTPAEFEGDVREGKLYIIVDDHVGFGGTIANLKGFIEGRGGLVVAATTLTKSPGSEKISPTADQLDTLRRIHGHALEVLWQDQFGHGIDCLTRREAQLLCREKSFVAVTDRLAQGSIEARERGLEIQSLKPKQGRDD